MQKMLLVSLITLALITPLQSMSMQRGSASAAAAQCLGSQCKKKPKTICPKCKEILFCSSKCKKQSMKAHAQVCGQNAGAGAAAAEESTMSIADALKLSQAQFNGLSLETHVALTRATIDNTPLEDDDNTFVFDPKLLLMFASLPDERQFAIRQELAKSLGFKSLADASIQAFDATRALASLTE